LAGEVSPFQCGELPLERRQHGGDQRRVPGDQHAGSGAMLRLGDEIGRDELGTCRFVRQDDDFTGAGNAVDVDLPEDMPFGEGYEQIAGSDDLVDSRDSFDAVGQCGHRLGPSDSIDFSDPQFMAGRQQVAVVGAELRRRNHDGNLRHSGRLRRHGRHQHRRGIGRSPAGDADADSSERKVTLPQFDGRGPMFPAHRNVPVQNRPLEFENVVPNPPDDPEKCRVRLGMSLAKILGRNPDGLGRQFPAVQFAGVFQERRQSLIADVTADLFHHLLRRQRLPEQFDGSPPTGFGDDVAPRTELLSQRRKERLGVPLRTIDHLHLERHGTS